MESTKTFNIHVVGNDTGETWDGDFEVKARLTDRDRLLRDNLYRFYLGDANPHLASGNTIAVAEMLSGLRVHLTKWPAWWAEKGMGEAMEDDNVTPLLYKQVMDFVKVHEAVKAKRIKAAQDELKKLGTLGEAEKEPE